MNGHIDISKVSKIIFFLDYWDMLGIYRIKIEHV